MNNDSKYSFLERRIITCLGYIKNYKIPIISAGLTAIIAYMFMFTNKIINWDDLQFLFGKGYTVTSGRWGLELLKYILPNYSMPWFYGVMSCVLLIISTCIIIDIFKIENKVMQGILAAVIIAFPSQIGTFFYMFTSTSYAIAFLLAVLTVYFCLKQGIAIKAVGILCGVFSMGIYQAYVSVIAGFFVLLLIKDLLSGKKNWLDVIKDGVKYFACLLIIGVLYYGITACVLKIIGGELNAWANKATSDSMGIINRIIRSYKLFAAMVLLKEYGLETTTLSWIAHIILVAFVGIASAVFMLKKKNIANFVLFGVLTVVALPLSVNSITLLIGENGVHALTLYSFICIYIFVAVVVDLFKTQEHARISNVFKDSVCVLMCVILASNVYVSNKSYLKQFLVYENTFSFYQAIVTQLQQTPGFEENTKLAVIGNVEKDSSYLENFGEDTIYGLCGFKGEAISEEFITYYLGFDVPIATEEEKDSLANTEDVKNMSTYPYYGYIQKIDDYIVVKLGN